MSNYTNSLSSINLSVKTAMIVSASILGLYAQAANSNEEIWRSAYEHFESGNALSCYQDMQALNYLVGDVTYDKLLGLCAQGADKNAQALLAYNRILAQQKNNAEIRLERARVFYNMNLHADAKEEFQWLLDRNPPQNAAVTIKQYLSAIKRKASKIKPYTRLRISTSIGHDDNVNSATELDDFLGFTLNDSSRATSSLYYGASFTAERNIKISHSKGLKISTSLSNKNYKDAEFANQDLALAALNYKAYLIGGILDLDVLAYSQKIDSEFNGRGVLFKAAYQKNLSDRISIQPYIRASALRYADNIAVRDVNQYALGAMFKHIPKNSNANINSLDFSIGRDYALFSDSNYEADFGVVSLSNRHKFNTILSSYTQLQYKKYQYDEPFFANSFPGDRNDDSLSAIAGLNWKLSNSLSLAPKISYRKGSSNVDLFSYDRWYAEISANYQWVW